MRTTTRHDSRSTKKLSDSALATSVGIPPPLQQLQLTPPSQEQRGGPGGDDVKSLWVGDLLHWMDETYLHTCFSHTEVSCVKVIRNKQSGNSEGYGYVEFLSRSAAEKALQSCRGSTMPNSDQPFLIDWASFSSTGVTRRASEIPNLSIFVDDLAPDVSDTVLLETFAGRYPSVKGAKVVIDCNTGRSKGYGFVRFGDENEQSRAITEMNGAFCSSRPMRVGTATPKKASAYGQQYSSPVNCNVLIGLALALAGGHDEGCSLSNNSLIFVGGLDVGVTEGDLMQPFSQFGEVVSVKIPVGKGCGFVQFANRQSAEEAIWNLNGSIIGKNTVRLSWGRNSSRQIAKKLDSGTDSFFSNMNMSEGISVPGDKRKSFLDDQEKDQQEKANELSKRQDQKKDMDWGISGGEAFSSVSGSGSNVTTVAGKFTGTALNTGDPKVDCTTFSNFLNNRGLTLSGCRATDIIDFLCAQKDLGDSSALVSRLSAASEGCGIKPKDNPFRSLAVIRYLQMVKRVYGKTECVLVFSYDNSLDVGETSFVKAILTELHERGLTPLTYNLSGRENLDMEMLYRCSVGIMIISNSFGRSSQSLDHLVAIMEHWKAKDLVVIPVYYMVSLSDILEGQFEPVQLQYLNYNVQADKVQNWKAAISELASIDGHQSNTRNQPILAKEVVRNACLRLSLKTSNNLVRILALLDHPQPSDAEIEGIWGMAGIGKTSIAREIFQILAPQYDLCYFLQDFHLICQSKGLRQIRDDFFSKVFREDKLSIGACDTKSGFMRDWFHNKAILVILDDVSNARDAEYVVGGFGWFSHGHRIILTSRRKQVLVQCKVKKPYKMQKLEDFESFRLCKQYLEEESVVVSELMSCSGGIPLALKVLVSSASSQYINNVKEHLHSLRRNPPTQIQEAFRRSFDELDENEKNIFLDLACFFGGDNKDHVVQLLDACGFLTYLGICDLIDESLISLVDNRIEIPIPFQDIGRFIVHEEDKDPCRHSRLWDSNDITYVLTNNSGTEAIEGIFLDASDLTCELSPTVFGKMTRLRLLKFYCSTSGNHCNLSLPQGLDTLPDELRLLHWENYPLKCLPQNFNPENLVEINMPYSNMEKLWEGKKNLEKLKKINLSHSRNLTDILMLSEALNLEHIDLEGCTSLVDVRTSIPCCAKLISLTMKDCSRLQSLPAMFELTSLKLLNMSGCTDLEEIQDFPPNLKELYLAGTAIRELPLSVENLTGLGMLDLENCGRLRQLPFGIRNSKSILKLKLSGCTSLELRKRKR